MQTTAMHQPEPNLIAETYRNQINQLPRRFEKHYDFMDINQDGVFLLGTSNLTGRIWSGSCWLFNDPTDPPDTEKCIAGMEFEAGISVGKWFDGGTKVVIGSDSGALNIISLIAMSDVDKHYLSTLAVLCEHDDSITTIDLNSSNNKILSGSMDMNIKIWDSESATCERTYEYAHSNTVTCLRYQPNSSELFLSTSTDGSCLIWDTNMEKPASLISSVDSGYTSCCWIDNTCIALGANSGIVSLIDLRNKAELDVNYCSKRPIYHMTYENDFLAVCADDPIVRVFSTVENVLSIVYECERHKDFVRGLSWFSPNQLYSCAWDSKILLHEIPVKSKAEQSNAMEMNASTKTNTEAQ